MAAENTGKYASLLTKEPKPLCIWSGRPFWLSLSNSDSQMILEWLIKFIRTDPRLLFSSRQLLKRQIRSISVAGWRGWGLVWWSPLLVNVWKMFYSEWKNKLNNCWVQSVSRSSQGWKKPHIAFLSLQDLSPLTFQLTCDHFISGKTRVLGFFL